MIELLFIWWPFPAILLLGEVLVHLASKPLDDAAIHSLIGFFTDRLVSLAFTVNHIVHLKQMMTRFT